MAQYLVIVTGGSSGIGRALLEVCPWRDARRIDVSRRGGSPGEHHRADLADPADWPGVADLFEREMSGFSGERVVLFHNAGTLEPLGFAGEVDSAGYARQVLLNSAAPQVLGDAFLRASAQTPARCELVMIKGSSLRGDMLKDGPPTDLRGVSDRLRAAAICGELSVCVLPRLFAD